MSIDLYEVRLRKEHRGVDLISDALPFGRLVLRAKRNQQPIGYAKGRGLRRPAIRK
jgi:hypothetical protein